MPISNRVGLFAGGFADVAGDANQSPATSALAETLPDSLKIALEEKPKGFSTKLGKALEKRVETPYGKQNIRIERSFDTHTKVYMWRVNAGVAGDNSYSYARENNLNFDEGENKKNNSLKSNRGETDPRNPPQKQFPVESDMGLNGSKSQIVPPATSAGGFKSIPRK